MPFGPASPQETRPDWEEHRLAVLEALQLLDTPPEAEFEMIVDAAQLLLRCPIALIAFADRERQWFKAKRGVPGDVTVAESGFCADVIRSGEIVVVNDASCDPRFRDHPHVAGGPQLRAYLGVPIHGTAGRNEPRMAIGTLCVIDKIVREFGDHEIAALGMLGKLVEAQLAGRNRLGGALRYAEERRADAARIARQHRRLRQAERLAGIGSWRLTLADELVEWSDQVFVIHELPVGQLPALSEALDFYPPADRARVAGAVAHVIETGEPFDIECDMITAKGNRRRVRSIGELEVEDGKPIAVLGVFQDVSQRHAVEQALRRTAHRDDLTGLANRAAFNDALEQAMNLARRDATPLALMLIDLDAFKQVNDRFGHIAGDEVLQHVGRGLRAIGTDIGLAARLGGDEFALIAPGLDAGAVAAVTLRVLAALAGDVELAGGTASISGSVGVSWLEAGVSKRELIHRADTALYEAKRAGRGVGKVYGMTVVIRPESASQVRAA